MSSFAEWHGRQRARLERIPRLEAALLAARVSRYLGMRLTPILINRTFGYALHVAEAFVLTRYLRGHHLVRSFLVAAACQLVLAAHWSATELMRQQLKAAPTKAQAQRIANAWLTASLIGAASFFVLGGIAIHLVFEGGPTEWIAESYGLVCVVRTAIDLYVRTVYSSAFAFGRIFRPLFSLWGPQWISFGSLLLSAKLLGAAGLPIGLLLGMPWSRLLTLHYVARSWRAARRPPSSPSWRALRKIEWRPRELVLAALAGALTRLGSFAVFAAAFTTDDPFRVALMYFLGPPMAAAAAFAQNLYPDFRRLLRPEARLLFIRFVWACLAASVVAALYWWAAASFVLALVLQPLTVVPIPMPPYLLVFLIGGAILSVPQIVLLARGDFGGLAIAGLLAVCVIVVPFSPVSGLLSLLGGVLLSLIRAFRAPPNRGALAQGSARTYSLDASQLNSQQRRVLLERLPKTVELVRHARRHMLLSSTLEQRELARAILLASSGLAGELLEAPASPPAPRDIESTLARIVAATPEAVVLRLRRPRAQAISSAVLQAVWGEVLRAGRTGRRRQRDYEVAALRVGQHVEAIVLVPKEIARQVPWRRALQESA